MFCCSSIVLIILDAEGKVILVVDEDNASCISVSREDNITYLIQVVTPLVVRSVQFPSLTVLGCRSS